MTKAILVTLTLFSLAISGCTPPPGDGFSDVRRAVEVRTDERLVWNRDADPRISDAVRALLARPLSADAAAQIALLNNRSLQANYEELGIAQADLVQAGLLKNPVFTLIARFPDKPPSGTDLEVSVAQDFLDVLMLPLRKKVAAAKFETVKLEVAQAVLDLDGRTRVAFYRLQGAEQMLELRRTVLDAASAAAEQAAALHRAGNMNDLDFGEHEALAEQTRLDLAAAEADANDDREELTALMGLWGRDTQFTIPPRLPDVPPADREIAPAGLESLAVSQRADLSAAHQQAQAFAASLGISRDFALLPTAEIGIDSERNPDGSPVTGPTFSAPVPLFDQGHAAVARAQSQLRQSQQRYIALAVQIRSDVRRLRNRMYAARARAEFFRRVVVPLRQRLVDDAQRQYNGMLLSVFQLLQAKQNEINAGGDEVESLRDYWVTRAELQQAVGGRLPTPGATTKPSETP